MAMQTYTDGRTVRHFRPAREAVSARSPLPDEAGPEGRAWPTDVQVWNWAESATLFGYGPSASNFF
ncbi:hypothetical protein [Streptomyces sp. VRA16 Mangrove soil]|uniref:hypothetical protein n=1 Tax=Streptomyces sp. VRA16 Mangrove soil TaxID=2817434 RepID=UPI001A9D5272|nr:hypothetical protein [Streptomyces sp. VRA16 Mangrove soil]MBO1329852.1 hypothetical protein [Streptomyces sp. VRA16 Mangrove soil]